MTVFEGRPWDGGDQVIVIERFGNEPGTIGRHPRRVGATSGGIKQVKLAVGQHHARVPGTNSGLNRDDTCGAIRPLILSIVPMVAGAGIVARMVGTLHAPLVPLVPPLSRRMLSLGPDPQAPRGARHCAT